VVATASVADGDLFLQVPGQENNKLVPKRPRLFQVGESDTTVEFVETDGKVTSVIAGGISLTRVEPA